jgi:hypothetical protein
MFRDKIKIIGNGLDLRAEPNRQWKSGTICEALWSIWKYPDLPTSENVNSETRSSTTFLSFICHGRPRSWAIYEDDFGPEDDEGEGEN